MKEFYRRNLPHYQPPFGIFFVTTRLAGSLPKEVVDQLRKEFARQLSASGAECSSNEPKHQDEIKKRYFDKFDQLLDDSSNGPLWLRKEEIASIVMEAIIHRDTRDYRLFCATIMPNHIHLVFELERNTIPLYKILQSLKRHTALHANRILRRSGAFWQAESYDNVVRDGAELERIIVYVFLNPEKAKLVKNAKDWKWTYVSEDFRYLINEV